MKRFTQFLLESEELFEEKDACYHKVMKSYGKWSARAAQAVAKCRKASGHVRKSKEGANLKRWGAEKWKDTKTGKPCGAGGKNEYCRPSKRVSHETPKTTSEMSSEELKRKKAEKSRVGMHGASGRKVSPLKRKKSVNEDFAQLQGNVSQENISGTQIPQYDPLVMPFITSRMDVDDGDDELAIYEEWFKLKYKEIHPDAPKESIEKAWKIAFKEIWEALESGKSQQEIVEIMRGVLGRFTP